MLHVEAFCLLPIMASSLTLPLKRQMKKKHLTAARYVARTIEKKSNDYKQRCMHEPCSHTIDNAS